MPNHVTNVLLCNPDFNCDGWMNADQFNAKHRDANLCEIVRPQPKELDAPKRPNVLTDAALKWQTANWGCKWGTYYTAAHDLPGDMQIVQICFCSPWSPPREAMPAIREWLYRECGLSVAAWIVGNPYDNSVTCE